MLRTAGLCCTADVTNSRAVLYSICYEHHSCAVQHMLWTVGLCCTADVINSRAVLYSRCYKQQGCAVQQMLQTARLCCTDVTNCKHSGFSDASCKPGTYNVTFLHSQQCLTALASSFSGPHTFFLRSMCWLLHSTIEAHFSFTSLSATLFSIMHIQQKCCKIPPFN